MEVQSYAGRCLCGNIEFALNGKPVWIGYCHCSSCRRATGAAAVTHVGVNDSDLSFVKGTRKIYESSPGVRRGFCSDCGSPVSYDSDRYNSYTQIYIGIFDKPELLIPQAHVHCDERIAWFNTKDNLPYFSGTGDDGSGDWKN